MNTTRISSLIFMLFIFNAKGQAIKKEKPDASSYILQYTEKFLEAGQTDTVQNRVMVYYTQVRGTDCYKIADLKRGITYIRDTTGFYTYTYSNQVLTSREEPKHFLLLYAFKFLHGQLFDSIRRSVPFSIDSISLKNYHVYSFDGISGTGGEEYKGIDYSGNIAVYKSRITGRVDKIAEQMWFMGMYQYSCKELDFYNPDVASIYDSINIDRQHFWVTKKINARLYEDSTETLWKKQYLNKTFSALVMKNTQGKKVNLKHQKSACYIVDFHYKACYPCWIMHDHLTKIQSEFGSEKVCITGINTIDENVSETREYYEKKSLSYDILFDDGTLKTAYELSAYPTLFLLDRDFKIIDILTGMSDDNIDIVRRFINSQQRN